MAENIHWDNEYAQLRALGEKAGGESERIYKRLLASAPARGTYTAVELEQIERWLAQEGEYMVEVHEDVIRTLIATIRAAEGAK